tara:strand:+ start:15209 stop:16150 length:942 start_codon:yes stop_codon:yes gene_type:complete
MSRLSRTLVFFALSSLLAGCKLAVIVGEGGDVLSQSSSRDCVAGNYCINEISDANFGEAFTAIPKAGHEFVRWQGGTGFLCGNSTDRTCIVALPGDEKSEAVVASYEVAYIMPVFKDVGIDSDNDGNVNRVDEDDDNDGILDVYDPCPLDPDTNCVAGVPIADIVTVNGKEWAQVDLFLNLSWDEINAVCPAGICADFGTLNGYDMTGWRWASVDDVNSLFNYYYGDYGSPALGPGPDLTVGNASIGMAFFRDGWRPVVDNGYQKLTAGFMANTAEYIAVIGPTEQSSNQTGLATGVRTDFVPIPGGWFYRIP